MAANKEFGRGFYLSGEEKEKVLGALKTGDYSAVVEYVNRGWDVDQELFGLDRFTALHCAAEWGRTEVARVLCKAGANINKQDWMMGRTPLHCAAWCGHTQTVKCLVEHNATVDVRDQEGWTPLHYAAWCGHTQIVKCLVEHNATVDVRNERGHTPLHLAAQGGRTAVVQFLIEHRANVNVCDEDGNTPVHLASQMGQASVVEVLDDEGSWDAAAVNKNGNTPLHVASSYGQLAVVELLLRRGARATVANTDGATAYDVCGDECNVFFNKVDDGTIEKIKKVLKERMGLEQQSGPPPPHEDAHKGPASVAEKANALLAALEGYINAIGESIPDGVVNVNVQVKRKDDSTLELCSVDTTLKEYFPRSVPVKKQSGLFGTIPDRGENVISAHFQKSLTNAVSAVAQLKQSDGLGVGSGFRVGLTYVMTNYHVYKLLSVDIIDDKPTLNKNAAIFYFDKRSEQCTPKAIPIGSLVAYNEELDVAVLELDFNSPLTAAFTNCDQMDKFSLPPAMTNFKAISQQEQVHFAGHPNTTDHKVVQVHCPVVLMDPADFLKTISELKQWAQKVFPKGFEAFSKIDDPKRTLYRTSPKFGHGSSGSPGFVPDDQQEASVAVIQTRGFPDLPDDHSVPQNQIKARMVEQGIRIEAVYDFLHATHPVLCRDIFGLVRPS